MFTVEFFTVANNLTIVDDTSLNSSFDKPVDLLQQVEIAFEL